MSCAIPGPPMGRVLELRQLTPGRHSPHGVGARGGGSMGHLQHDGIDRVRRAPAPRVRALRAEGIPSATVEGDDLSARPQPLVPSRDARLSRLFFIPYTCSTRPQARDLLEEGWSRFLLARDGVRVSLGRSPRSVTAATTPSCSPREGRARTAENMGILDRDVASLPLQGDQDAG